MYRNEQTLVSTKLDHSMISGASFQHGSAHETAGITHKYRNNSPRRNHCTGSPRNKQEKRELASVQCRVKPKQAHSMKT